jgi:thioredoxin reductase (NADPH)
VQVWSRIHGHSNSDALRAAGEAQCSTIYGAGPAGLSAAVYGAFYLHGGAPQTDWATQAGIIRDEAGYLVTGPDMLKEGRLPASWPLDRSPYYLETNIPGMFAAGDVRHGAVKRCASAVGEGAMAVTFVHRYLADS